MGIDRRTFIVSSLAALAVSDQREPQVTLRGVPFVWVVVDEVLTPHGLAFWLEGRDGGA
jgi:hypothetical protein